MTDTRSSILQGTLDLMVLKTLEQMGPLHGYGIARRIEQVGQDAVIVNQGTIYLCLVRLVQNFPAANDRSTMYHPMAPGRTHPVSLTLRGSSNAALDAGSLREITRALDPTLRVDALRRLDEIYRQRQSADNMVGLVLTIVMLIVTLFSISGIYTLTTFTVAQRRREIGLRSALGAQPSRLVTGIFGRALVPVVLGGVIGSLVAFLIDYYVPIDEFVGENIPGIVPASAVFMIVVALFALAGPARRAIRINPTEALRGG